VREAERRVAELQAELAREPETVPRTEVEPDLRLRQLQEAEINAARQVAALRAQLATMRRTANSLALASRRMPSKLDRLQRLLDRAELGKTAYQNILAQLETARLNEAMKQADAYIIDHAANPDEISPKLGRMLAFAFLLGIVCGIVLAMVLEALDDTFHTPDDITAYTDVTFLGIVPLLEEPGPGLVAASAPKSPPAEAYRTLRSNIRFAQLDSPARTFLVTSAGAGEGKTLTTANLAAVFAQAGQEVLLVDTDLRRPSLHRLLNLSAEHGLTNVLMGEATLEEVTQDTEIPGLRVVTTGPLPPNPAELIESRHMTAVIERAREMADVVFFDSPPAIILTDAVILSSKVERTLLVAEAGQVSRDAFNEMCRMIRNARGEILGVVLNKLRLSASDYYYYYYYYDYSHSAPRRDSGPSGAATPGGNQGLVRPEAPTVLDTLFGEEPPTSGPPRQGAAVTPTPDDAMLLPGEEPRPAAGATPARPTDDGRPAAMPPGTRRWRFNGRSFRAETPNGDGTARRGNDTPTGPAEGGPGPEDGAQTPPAANGSSANADRSILEDLFGESEDEK
jgi:capsular exopolysaccharide synthesis family protein